MNAPRMLTPKETANILGVREHLLAKWRSMGGGPRYAKFGRNVRYPQDNLLDWVAARTVTNTSRTPSDDAETKNARGEGPQASE
jgi:hypothetical protein